MGIFRHKLLCNNRWPAMLAELQGEIAAKVFGQVQSWNCVERIGIHRNGRYRLFRHGHLGGGLRHKSRIGHHVVRKLPRHKAGPVEQLAGGGSAVPLYRLTEARHSWGRRVFQVIERFLKMELRKCRHTFSAPTGDSDINPPVWLVYGPLYPLSVSTKR